jgi:hypothetical protein
MWLTAAAPTVAKGKKRHVYFFHSINHGSEKLATAEGLSR